MRIAREFIEALLLAALVFFVLQASIQNFQVKGYSMEPTLNHGERLLVNKIAYFSLNRERLSRFLPFIDRDGGRFYLFGPPKRGDIVVFRFPAKPSEQYVKRVIGLPGETIEIRGESVFVNGKPIEEPYLEHPSNDLMPPLTLGPDEYFVMGDNRSKSNDSRDWGPVPSSHMIGKIWIGYWLPKAVHVF